MEIFIVSACYEEGGQALVADTQVASTQEIADRISKEYVQAGYDWADICKSTLVDS